MIENSEIRQNCVFTEHVQTIFSLFPQLLTQNLHFNFIRHYIIKYRDELDLGKNNYSLCVNIASFTFGIYRGFSTNPLWDSSKKAIVCEILTQHHLICNETLCKHEFRMMMPMISQKEMHQKIYVSKALFHWTFDLY